MQHTPGTVVVGVDGSASSSRALTWAIKQAVAEHRPLTLAHTARDAAGSTVLADARARVQAVAPDLEVHEVFEIADPRAVLLRLSADAAVLVVGSRGRGKVRSLLLGSVSIALVRHAHCPVVVIRPGRVGTVRNGVLVGIDATELSQPVLEFSYRQASLHDLPLTVLHTWWDIMAGTTGAYLASLDPRDVEAEHVSLAEAMAGMTEKYPDVHVTTHVGPGIPEDGLVGLGERMDLIVVGAHQQGPLRRAFAGSVSVDVVERATGPVAIVPLSGTL
jgi:nucleotide-binding universal stress UspA family protein